MITLWSAKTLQELPFPPLVPHGAVQEEGIAVAYLHSTVSAIRDQVRSIHPEATTYLKRVCDNCSETGVVSVDSVRKILDRIATCAVCDTPSSISVMELSVANEIGAEESISRQRLFIEYSAVMQDMWSGFISRCLRCTRGSSSSVVSSTNYSSYQRPAMLMPTFLRKPMMSRRHNSNQIRTTTITFLRRVTFLFRPQPLRRCPTY
eukprot:PhF_6_TR34159/c0_g1_i3/m.49918